MLFIKILIKIAFLGTKYNGYQIQKNKPTIQACLNTAAYELFGYDCDITGCSRTDSGVHANCFCATIAKKGTDGIETQIPIDKIPAALNARLPNDISVFDACAADGSFHPRYSVKYKEYIYRIYNGAVRNPFEEGRSLHFPRKISDEMLSDMNEAARHFCGEHDFSSYMASGSKISDTVRNVMYASVYREGDIVIFRIAANGFLYNMVRIMTGTLLAVAQGKATPEDIDRITEAKKRSAAFSTAPACGLYLNKIVY